MTAESLNTPNTEKDVEHELRARVKELEAILLCLDCDHLRSEHDNADAPCFGGRNAMPVGEGKYCMCLGFISEESK